MVEHLVTEAVSVFLIDADWTAQIASARHHPWLQFPCRAEPPYGLGANRCVSSDSMATHPKTQAKKERETQREGPEEAGGPKGEEERWSTISLSSSLLFSSLLSSSLLSSSLLFSLCLFGLPLASSGLSSRHVNTQDTLLLNTTRTNVDVCPTF